ncbi:MAG: DCC1-like thiol-disulfide oxidoreductase family protein [Myxococcota bacterium]
MPATGAADASGTGVSHDASARGVRDVAAHLPERIVFFDAVCGFCDAAVQALLARDPDGRLHFAPLQGEAAAALRAARPDAFPPGIDTFVYAARERGALRVRVRSEAALAVARELGVAPRAIALLALVPRPLLDLAYRAFAAVRYRVFGRLDACRVPTPAERARFLD